MQLTLGLEIVGLAYADRTELDALMQRYCSTKRVAFKMLLQGKGLGETIHRLETLSSLSLNWRYCEHAARDASAAIRSQGELLPLYLSDVYDRIEETEKKLEKRREAKPGKASSLEERLSRLKDRGLLATGLRQRRRLLVAAGKYSLRRSI
jgi:hypothetical protein